MASTPHAVGIALVAVLFWTALGFPIARRFLGNAWSLPFAPTVGWAVHGVVAVPVFYVLPWSAGTVAGLATILLVASWRVFASKRDRSRAPTEGARIPVLAWLGAALVAIVVAAAIVPKVDGATVLLSSPIFDHSKAAMIDSMIRSGLPAANPFIAHDGNGDRLAYYYLWHFSAAQLGRLCGASGWEADIAMTFFSALTSLLAMMALAIRCGGRASAAGWVLLVATAASARPLLEAVFGEANVSRWVEGPGGFQGWFFQASWVPQHLMSTTCVLLALILMSGLSRPQDDADPAATNGLRRIDWPRAILLGVAIAAGFESSTWVGGVVFAVCCVFVVPYLLLRAAPRRRLAFVNALLAAALVTILLAWPFLSAQLAAASTRQTTAPIVVSAFSVLGDAWPSPWRRLLNPTAFWFPLLPIEFTAVFFAGLVTGWRVLRGGAGAPGELRTLAVAAIGALATAWLLVSTLADNNDLGWRAGLLSVVLLIVFAAAGLARWVADRRWLPASLALIAVAAGLPDSAHQVRGDLTADPQPDGAAFATAPALWARVRTIAAPAERVANNPLALRTLTPWPVNIGWALLADRPSCYSTWELVQVYSSIPHDRLRATDNQFIRVFDGHPEGRDVAELATVHDCAVVVVTPADGAWAADPFRDGRWYRLADEKPGEWRIYRRRVREASLAGAPVTLGRRPASHR